VGVSDLKAWLKSVVWKKNFYIISAASLLFSFNLAQEVSALASKNQQTLFFSFDNGKNSMINSIISSMSDKEKIGQLVMPSIRLYGSSVPDENIGKLIQEYNVGSVIAYGHADAESTAKSNNQLQKWAFQTRLKLPLFISADLEYGTRQLITDGTDFPRQMGIGASRDLGAAEHAAKINAIEAKAMGFNWNYSPLVDINTNPSNPVIGVRSFGEKTNLVSQMTVAQIKGYQQNGVLATAKHFPGHGDTSVDSHLGLAAVTYDRKTLEDIHLSPFKAAITEGVDSIMTAHVIINAIDSKLPATLSEKVLTGILRNQLGFDGIIVTDSMSMNAIDQHWGTGQAAVMAINAGADIVMATGSYKNKLETCNALYHALKSGTLSEKRVNESLHRILSAKLKFDLSHHRYVNPLLAKQIVNTPSHKEFAAEIARNSITLLKNEKVLPFNAKDTQTTLIVGPKILGSSKYMDSITKTVQNKVSGKVLSFITSTNSTNAEIIHSVELAKKANRIIVATFSASSLSKGQVKLVNSLQKSGKSLVVLSLGLPYDIKNFPQIGAYVATYSIDRWGSPVPTVWNAAVDTIFGSKPGGKLPVDIKGLYKFGDHLVYEGSLIKK
jgi:beta-N-acetylhexosaminidase